MSDYGCVFPGGGFGWWGGSLGGLNVGSQGLCGGGCSPWRCAWGVWVVLPGGLGGCGAPLVEVFLT